MALVTSEMLKNGAHVQVAMGGACNILTSEGSKRRNDGRDYIAKRLGEKDISYYEVQIPPDRIYDPDLDGPMEEKARKDADVVLYEVRCETSALATYKEINEDALSGRCSIVWFRPGARKFVPEGIGTVNDWKQNTAAREFLGEFYFQFILGAIQDVNRLWDYLDRSLPQNHNLAVIETDDEDAVLAVILQRLAE